MSLFILSAFECVLSVIPVGSLLGVSKPIVILVLSGFWMLQGTLSDLSPFLRSTHVLCVFQDSPESAFLSCR
jgi:hypothetical protein